MYPIPLLLLLLGCPTTKDSSVPDPHTGDTGAGDTAPHTGDTAPDTGETALHTGDTGRPDTGPDTAPPHTGDTGDTGVVDPPLAPCFDPADFDPSLACDDADATYTGAYYDGIDPASGDLLDELHDLVSDVDYEAYDDLWAAFPLTDVRDDGTIWDIYSDYAWVPLDDQCGSYGGEGDCYNREHTWPQSWSSNDASLKRDLHQVFPTDGYVNGVRGNLVYGEVDRVDYTSSNGSTAGWCDVGDDHVEAFEPADDYKGDLARVYFYVATRFAGEDGGWLDNEMVTGALIAPEAEILLRRWAAEDRVSEKEIARNEAVFAWQGNRNPFVDHPEWVCAVADF